MARARNIKPGFFANEALAEFEPWVRLLFVGLWTVADRSGRFEVRPKRIRAALFPYDGFDVEAGITALARFGFLTVYEVGGVLYAEISNWAKHQNPHVKEAPSTIPAPGMVQEPEQHRASTVPAVLIPDSLIPDSLIPDSGLLIQKKNQRQRRVAAPLVLPEWLSPDDWGAWDDYRTKRGKGWTDHAQRLSLVTLGKLREKGHPPKTVIEQSIERGWTGLFKIDEDRGDHGNGTRGKGAGGRVDAAIRRRFEKG
jgi:hypothetical protein